MHSITSVEASAAWDQWKHVTDFIVTVRWHVCTTCICLSFYVSHFAFHLFCKHFLEMFCTAALLLNRKGICIWSKERKVGILLNIALIMCKEVIYRCKRYQLLQLVAKKKKPKTSYSIFDCVQAFYYMDFKRYYIMHYTLCMHFSMTLLLKIGTAEGPMLIIFMALFNWFALNMFLLCCLGILVKSGLNQKVYPTIFFFYLKLLTVIF